MKKSDDNINHTPPANPNSRTARVPRVKRKDGTVSSINQEQTRRISAGADEGEEAPSSEATSQERERQQDEQVPPSIPGAFHVSLREPQQSTADIDNDPDEADGDDNQQSPSSCSLLNQAPSAPAATAAQVQAVSRDELVEQGVLQATTEQAVVISSSSPSDDKRSRKQKKMLLFGIGMLLLVAIVVGTVVGVLRSKDDDSSLGDVGDDSLSAGEGGLSLTDTESPSQTPRTMLFDFIREQLPGKAGNSLNDPESSAGRAYAALVSMLLTKEDGERNANDTTSVTPILYAPDDHDSAYYATHFVSLGIFFLDTRGPTHWTRADGWMTADPICSWYGIGCYPNGTLEALRLPNNTLQGTIPGDQFSFESLRVINLERNEFDQVGGRDSLSSLPSAFGRYHQLEELYLGYNGLKSEFPLAWYQGMTSVKILDLQYNDVEIAGSLHREIDWSVHSFEEVRLAGNDMSNDILEFPWSPHLRVLDLSDGSRRRNNITIPDDFGANNILRGGWPNITEIYLHNNPSLIGSISSELCDTVMANDGLIKVDCERVTCECCDCA